MSATKLKSVDVVVVGSGVVGSIMSMELASAGMSVVCLERGKQFDATTDFHKPNVYDELKFDRHSDIFQNLARDTITFRNNDAQTALPMREMGAFKPGEMVGGTAAHWGGNARRFLPHDFEMYSRIKERYGQSFIPEDCNLQDWGVTWDDIEPYYDQFEEIFGVGGKAGNLDGEIQTGGNPHEGPRSREYPNPPTRRTHEGALFADAVSSLGYVPFQGPTAAMPCLRARRQGQSPLRGATRARPAALLRVAPAVQRAARQRGFDRQEGHRRHLYRRSRQRSRAAGQHRRSRRLLL